MIASLIGACGRTGFFDSDLEEGSETALSGQSSTGLLADTTPPFGGATVSYVSLDGIAARLQRQSGFAVRQTRLPYSVAAAAAAGLEGQIYVAGGAAVFPERGSCTDAVWAYDPIQDAITASETLTHTNQGLQLVAHPDGNLYTLQGYCDGEPSNEERSAYRIVPASLTPTLVGLFESTSYFNSGGVLADASGTNVLVSVGGYGTGPVKDLIQILDPSDGTPSLATAVLPYPRCLAASAVVNGTLFVLGGNTYSNSCRLPSVNSSDPTVDEILALTIAPEEVSVVAHLEEPLAASCAVARADGTILLFGGASYADIGGGQWQRKLSSSVWVFDPGAGEVTLHPAELPAPRAAMACGATDSGQIVLFGGADESFDGTDEIWLFEPYRTDGSIVSPSIDSGHADTLWTEITVDADVPASTSLTLEARVNDTANDWPDDDTGWRVVPINQPLNDTLPNGRYLQWRLGLESANPASTPQVRGLRLDFTF